MAQLDAGRISAMLSANANLQFLVYFAAALDRDSHQSADAHWIELLERVFLINPAIHVVVEELARVVARNPIRHLRKIVGAEREKLRHLPPLIGGHARARHFD